MSPPPANVVMSTSAGPKKLQNYKKLQNIFDKSNQKDFSVEKNTFLTYCRRNYYIIKREVLTGASVAK